MKIDMNMKVDMDMDMNMDMDEGMKTWTRIRKHGWGHGNGQGHGNMDEDIETWTKTRRHCRGHDNIDEDMETRTRAGNAKRDTVNEKWKTEAQAIFRKSIYSLLIAQMEVCRLSICCQRNKQKLSVFTKMTSPSMITVILWSTFSSTEIDSLVL